MDGGIEDFMMINDSFGYQAADMTVMNRLLREEFVKIYYEKAVLKEFHEQVKGQLPGEIEN